MPLSCSSGRQRGGKHGQPAACWTQHASRFSDTGLPFVRGCSANPSSAPAFKEDHRSDRLPSESPFACCQRQRHDPRKKDARTMATLHCRPLISRRRLQSGSDRKGSRLCQ